MDGQEPKTSTDPTSDQATARANPVLPFGTVLVALALFVAHLAETLANPGLAFLVAWSIAGLVCSMLVLVGVCRGHALAYCFGVVLAPIGSALLLFNSLLFFDELGAGWVPTLGIVALGMITPIAWARGSVKRVFGLTCPQCHSLQIGAQSFTFYKRWCWSCGTVFQADGTILRMGPGANPQPTPTGAGTAPHTGTPQMPSFPPASARYPAPPGVAMPGAPQGPPCAWAFVPGQRGRVMKHTWFIVLSTLVLGITLIMLMTALAEDLEEVQQGPYADRSISALDLISSMFICVGMPALLLLSIYWLIWVYRVHKEMRIYTNYGYGISPGLALGLCFIPLFNIFWRIYMPYRLAVGVRQYLGNRRGAFEPGAVLAFYGLALVPGSCVPGLNVLLIGLGMREIQKGLNMLWTEGPPLPTAMPLTT